MRSSEPGLRREVGKPGHAGETEFFGVSPENLEEVAGYTVISA